MSLMLCYGEMGQMISPEKPGVSLIHRATLRFLLPVWPLRQAAGNYGPKYAAPVVGSPAGQCPLEPRGPGRHFLRYPTEGYQAGCKSRLLAGWRLCRVVSFGAPRSLVRNAGIGNGPIQQCRGLELIGRGRKRDGQPQDIVRGNNRIGNVEGTCARGTRVDVRNVGRGNCG